LSVFEVSRYDSSRVETVLSWKEAQLCDGLQLNAG